MADSRLALLTALLRLWIWQGMQHQPWSEQLCCASALPCRVDAPALQPWLHAASWRCKLMPMLSPSIGIWFC